MKKLEIIIKPEKLEDLKGVLDTEEVNGLNIVNSISEMVRSSCMMSKMQSVFVQVSMARKHCKPV